MGEGGEGNPEAVAESLVDLINNLNDFTIGLLPSILSDDTIASMGIPVEYAKATFNVIETLLKELMKLKGAEDYTNEVKSALLGVDPALLEEKGAVSPEVAQAMALGARKALGCDLAISFTVVAGPGPDDRGNTEGLVFAALAYGDEVWVRRLSGWRDRDRIRTMAVSNGLDMIRRMVLGLERK